jgi:protein-disulfide isomerase
MQRLPTILGIWMIAAILPSAGLKAGDSILARVGDRGVTAREIEQSLTIPLYDLEMEKYRLMRRRLDQKVVEELLARAANDAGKSVSAYVTEQVQAQLASVSDDDVDARYRAETDSGALSAAENGNGQLAKQRIRNLLLRERASQGLQMLIQRLKAEAKVSIELRPPDPPVVQLSDGNDPSIGPANAPVTIVEYGDFECPICKESVAVLKQLRRLYPEQVRLVYRDFPLPAHPQARPAAEAAQCAHEQGQFWAYHDALFAHAPEVPDYLELAQRLHLNSRAFDDCLVSAQTKAAVSKDLEEAQRLGLSGTPTFFVNGRYLSGFQTLDALREAVDRTLDSGQPVGVQPSTRTSRP